MITQQIPMVRKETNQDLVRIRSRFDCVENSAETMIQISNLTVVPRLHDFHQCGIDSVRPNGISHERDLFIKMIFLGIAKNWIRHSVGIVHPVERNWRRKRRMRTDKRYEPEKRARIIGVCDLLHRAIGRPPFAAELGWKRAALREVMHLGASASRMVEESEFRILARQP